jgi:hypothetical protein
VHIQLECLEARSLLSVTPLATANSTQAVFANLLGELQSQVEHGPLAILTHTNITIQQSDDFVSGVSAVVSTWEHAVAELLPSRPGLVHLLDLQGTAFLDTEVQWQMRFQDNLYPTTRGDSAPLPDPTYNYLKAATTTVRQLTESRLLWPMDTPDLALYERADILAHTLATDVVNTLASGSTPHLSPVRAETLGLAEAQAFQADFDASLTTRPLFDRIAGAAVSTLEANLRSLIQQGVDPATQAQFAQQQFVQQMFAGTGLFGPQGPLHKEFQAPVNPFDNPQHTVNRTLSPSGSQYATMYTFTDAKVTVVTLQTPTTYYRVFSDPAFTTMAPSDENENNYEGTFDSTLKTFNPVTAIREFALDQSFYHPNYATMKVNVTALAGTTVYVGKVAPILQGVYSPESKPSLYPGGVNQTVLPASVAFNLKNYSNPRPIGAV